MGEQELINIGKLVVAFVSYLIVTVLLGTLLSWDSSDDASLWPAAWFIGALMYAITVGIMW